MSEQSNFSIENRPERGYLYNLLKELNILGIENLDNKGIELQVDGTTTYKIMTSINNISGGPGPKIGTQYCIQGKSADYFPNSLDEFKFDEGIVEDENKFKISLPNENRRSNTFYTNAGTNNGYIYYLSPLNNLTFSTSGFTGGFKIIAETFEGKPSGYTLYRSNQRVTKAVEFKVY